MKKLGVVALSALMVLGMSSGAMAAEGDVAMTIGIISIAAILGVSIAAIGCGFSMAVMVYSACSGIARNPEASGKITVAMILGIAFAESLTIFTLVIALILLFAHPFGHLLGV